MDEQDDHWNDILNIAKTNKLKQQSPVTELDTEQKAQLDTNVHEHIDHIFDVQQLNDQHFKLSSNQVERGETSAKVLQHPVPGENFLTRLRRLKDHVFSIGRVPALALVALMAITFGLLNNTNETTDPFADIPDSLFSAGLDKQIVVSSGGQRALISISSQRRQAFVSGAIKANLDVIQEADSSSVAVIIGNYPDYFLDNTASQEDKLALFQKRTGDLAADSHARFWLQEGYMIELMRLASLSALDTFETDSLNTAIEHFKTLTDLENGIKSSDVLNPNYLVKRKQITATTIDKEFAPDEIQRVVDLTQSLQVLVQ